MKNSFWVYVLYSRRVFAAWWCVLSYNLIYNYSFVSKEMLFHHVFPYVCYSLFINSHLVREIRELCFLLGHIQSLALLFLYYTTQKVLSWTKPRCRVRVSPCQVSRFWRFISSSPSLATTRGQGGIVFSIATLLKMRATITASASSPVWRHGDFYFRTTTSRRRWCRRHQGGDCGIIFSSFFSVLMWLDLAIMKDQGVSFRSVFLILR
jgi:hypothetical protein